VLQETLGLEDQMGLLVLLVPRGRKEPLVRAAFQDQTDNQDQRDKLVHRDNEGTQDQRDQMVSQGQQVSQGQLVNQDPMGTWVQLDPRVLADSPVLRAVAGLLVLLVKRVNLDSLDQRGR
jgi:hypothetical protein